MIRVSAFFENAWNGLPARFRRQPAAEMCDRPVDYSTRKPFSKHGLTSSLLLTTSVLVLASCTAPNHQASSPRIFNVRGVVKEIQADGRTALSQHEAIPNYMPAMTMPFPAKKPAELAGLRPGDEISFRLSVNQDTSWIDQISPTGRKVALAATPASSAHPTQPTAQRHPLLDYQFTNELGQAISLSQFQGQALAITFFFTRCPIPQFCPRLSQNFEEASAKLAAIPGAPTNWHFLSVSFDTQFDTPAVLRAYAQRYHYDPARWSFLTGPKEQVWDLARESGVTIEPDSGLFNHGFRTLIIDAAGRLQMSFPIGGNLSEAIVSEILKAAAAK